MNDNAKHIAEICRHFATDIPPIYAEFLLDHSEKVRDDGLSLYQASDVVERNDTFGVQRFTTEFLAVGDDSGDQLIVIRFADALATPFIIDAGAIVPNRPESLLKPLAGSWREWTAKGRSLQPASER